MPVLFTQGNKKEGTHVLCGIVLRQMSPKSAGSVEGVLSSLPSATAVKVRDISSRYYRVHVLAMLYKAFLLFTINKMDFLCYL